MANAYCELWASDDSIGGKFGVLYQGRNRELQKGIDVSRTIGGGIDVTQGAILEVHDYTIRVRHTEERSGYGDIATLEALYRLNDPGGTPSNVITFIDHYENESEAYLIGNYSENLLGVSIVGTTAWFLVRLQILLKPS